MNRKRTIVCRHQLQLNILRHRFNGTNSIPDNESGLFCQYPIFAPRLKFYVNSNLAGRETHRFAWGWIFLKSVFHRIISFDYVIVRLQKLLTQDAGLSLQRIRGCELGNLNDWERFRIRLWKSEDLGIDHTKWNCAQIVPGKVKYFQMVPNEIKNTMKNWNSINCM